MFLKTRRLPEMCQALTSPGLGRLSLLPGTPFPWSFIYLVCRASRCSSTTPTEAHLTLDCDPLCWCMSPPPDWDYIGMSACLAGAVFGDHCSPISDTTIMASAGAMCNHVNHVATQLPYAACVGIICFVNYIIAGFVQNAWICLVIGAAITICTLFVIRSIVSKKDVKAAA